MLKCRIGVQQVQSTSVTGHGVAADRVLAEHRCTLKDVQPTSIRCCIAGNNVIHKCRVASHQCHSAAIPFLVVVGWYLKNLIVFGSFAASTWMGMSMWKGATWNLSRQERLDLVAE